MTIQTVSPHEVHLLCEKGGNARIVDVRTSAEFAIAHAEGDLRRDRSARRALLRRSLHRGS